MIGRYKNLFKFLGQEHNECPKTGCITSKHHSTRPKVSIGKGRSMHVYRLVAELALLNGELLYSSSVVRHKCDNGMCFNPDHLELGSIADNNRDRKNF